MSARNEPHRQSIRAGAELGRSPSERALRAGCAHKTTEEDSYRDRLARCLPESIKSLAFQDLPCPVAAHPNAAAPCGITECAPRSSITLIAASSQATSAVCLHLLLLCIKRTGRNAHWEEREEASGLLQKTFARALRQSGCILLPAHPHSCSNAQSICLRKALPLHDARPLRRRDGTALKPCLAVSLPAASAASAGNP